MTSAVQMVANRRNAQHSTGPRTSAGKPRSSQNALKHGFTGVSWSPSLTSVSGIPQPRCCPGRWRLAGQASVAGAP